MSENMTIWQPMFNCRVENYKKFSKISAYLYVCDASNVTIVNLWRNEINIIINMKEDNKCLADGSDDDIPSCITYYHCPTEPNKKEISKWFDTVSKIVVKAKGLNKRVLIFCDIGNARAPTIGCACLMRCENWPVLFAIIYMKIKRRSFDLRYDMWKGLCDFEEAYPRVIDRLCYNLGDFNEEIEFLEKPELTPKEFSESFLKHLQLY